MAARKKKLVTWKVSTAYGICLAIGFLFLTYNILNTYLEASSSKYKIRIERSEENVRMRPFETFNWHEEEDEEDSREIKEEIQREIRNVFYGSMNGGCSKIVTGLEKIRDMKIFFAADLHNNQEVLAHWMAEFLKVVTYFKRENIFVSIYDSDSSDTTPTWIMLLKSLLQIQGIPHHIVSDPFHGRVQGQHRIDFMARVRNKALEPLAVIASHQDNLGYFLEDFSNVSTLPDYDASQLGKSKVETNSERLGASYSESSAFYDRIVFLNDVFFCSQDIIRLLQHEVDMVCGMDYDFLDKKAKAPQFYDTWVARDLKGRKLTKKPPHFEDLSDQLKLLSGEPIQVQCCWNGIAVIKAEPFHRGLRFRHVRKGAGGATRQGRECKASECSHLCDDLWWNSYRRIIIDPRVKVAYKWHDWVSALESALPRGKEDIDLLNSHVKESDKLDPAPPEQMTCCSMSMNKRDTTTCSKVSFKRILEYSPCLCLGGQEGSCQCTLQK